MEDKQVDIRELKPIPKPMGELKRPLLLSIIIIYWIISGVVGFVVAIYSFSSNSILEWKDFTSIVCNLCGMFVVVAVFLIGIFILIRLWDGFRWARIFIIVLGILGVILSLISIITNFSILDIMYFIINTLILYYIIFNKAVQSYCSK